MGFYVLLLSPYDVLNLIIILLSTHVLREFQNTKTAMAAFFSSLVTLTYPDGENQNSENGGNLGSFKKYLLVR